MVSYTNIKPTAKYEVERFNYDNNKYEVAFYELDSVKVETKEENGETYKVYSVNKYVLNLGVIDNLEENYIKLLNAAKTNEYNTLATQIRAKRDKLLAETDWTQVSDNALTSTEKEAYRVYRQALRNIPEQEGFPYNVVFPKI